MDIHDLGRIGNIHTKQLERVIELLEALVKQGEEITSIAEKIKDVENRLAKLEV